MWQRNDTGHVVDVAAYPDEDHPDRRPFSVGPGEVTDFDELLGGFTETDAPDTPAEDAHETPRDGAKQTKTRSKRAAQDTDPEGVEQQ